jgi:hypothetical protein
MPWCGCKPTRYHVENFSNYWNCPLFSVAMLVQQGEQKADLPVCGAGDNRREEVAGHILSYFLRHPTAMDSFEGIVRWRVMEEMVHRSMASTEQALQELIAEGYLTEEAVPGGKPIYRLNHERRAEAELKASKTKV